MDNLSASRLFNIGDEFAFCRQSLDEKFGAHENHSLFYFTCDSEALNPVICKGDTLIVDRSLNPTNGKIVIVSYQGEFLCRRLKRQGANIVLYGEKVKDLYIREGCDLEFFGVVIGLAREFS